MTNKEAQEKMYRAQNIQNTKQGLESQLQFSQYQKQLALQQKVQEGQEMQLKIQKERELQEKMQNQKIQYKNEYSKTLQQQTIIQKDSRFNFNKMSDQERRLNGQLIEAYKQEAPTNVKLPGFISDYSSTILRNSAQSILGQNKQMGGNQQIFSQQQSPNSRMQIIPSNQASQKPLSRNFSLNPQQMENGRQLQKNPTYQDNLNQFYGVQENSTIDYTQEQDKKNFQDNLNQFYGVQENPSRASARVNQINDQDNQNQFQEFQKNPSRVSNRGNVTLDNVRTPRSWNNSIMSAKQIQEANLRHDPILNPIGFQRGQQPMRRKNNDLF